MLLYQLMKFYSFDLFFFSLMFEMFPGSSSSSGQTTKVTTKEHEGFEPAEGDLVIDEIVWGNMRDMSVKDTIKVKAKSMELPIQLYSKVYKTLQSLRHNAVRLSSIAMLWMPTSIHFEGFVTIMVMDERFTNDRRSKLTMKDIKPEVVHGKLIAAVTFDPNYQQLISGSLNFATAVSDIDKIKFYMMFDNLDMPTSTAGFLSLSWKTIGSGGAIFNEVQWDVFRFPRVNVQEVDNSYGKNLFERLKIDMKAKYEVQQKKMEELEKLRFDLAYSNDAGVSKITDTANKYELELGKLLVDTDKHLQAIAMHSKKELLLKLLADFRVAINTRNPAKIQEKRLEIIKTCKDNNIEIPKDLDNKFEVNTGYVTVANKDHVYLPAD
nr:membrane-located protein [Actinidia chlorotic ringspot-associated virus]